MSAAPVLTSNSNALNAVGTAGKEILIAENLINIGEDRELGVEAVFTISSAKPGNGVEQLRDDNLETYWQSDGSFPHLINVQFLRKVSITKFCLYVDHSVDESYTPKKVSVNIGSCAHDLVEILSTELNDPTGWVILDLTKSNFVQTEDPTCVRAHFLQLKITSMHQNGKDTHIRQVKVFGKRESQRVMADLYHDDFKTKEMAQFCVIR
jgi:anaphase-promoting complex subunit 10